MHDAARKWVDYCTDDLPAGLKVVEFGSINVNGGVRDLFKQPSRYLGIDLCAGPGVDLVADAATWEPDELYDVAITTETLEHCERWRDILRTAARSLRPGGRLIVTCAGPFRKPHGRHGSQTPEGGEWYANITEDELRAALADGWIQVVANTLGEDVRAVATRSHTHVERAIANDDLYRTEPRVGVVISTFAAVPYVHLLLESLDRERDYPGQDVTVMVRDDGSKQSEWLQSLCEEYGADFSTCERAKHWMIGDVTSLAEGLKWANGIGIDLLVKFSRRFLPLVSWIADLKRLAVSTQMPTFSHECTHTGFGFRTECMALHVPSWMKVLPKIEATVATQRYVFVEQFVHQLGQELIDSTAAKRYNAQRPPGKSGYAVWPIMHDNRFTKDANYLWHDCDTPLDYARVAKCWGLPYGAADFVDPNMGEGNGEP